MFSAAEEITSTLSRPAAFAHNFGLAGVAASADAAGGVPTAGRIAVVIGIVFVLAISLLNMPKKADA